MLMKLTAGVNFTNILLLVGEKAHKTFLEFDPWPQDAHYVSQIEKLIMNEKKNPYSHQSNVV